MIYEIEIQDKLFRDIDLFCKINNLELNDYLVNKIREQFFIDKYGDLNTLKNNNVEKEVEKTDKKIKPPFIVNERIEKQEIIIEEKNEVNVKEDITNNNRSRRQLKSK